MRIEFDEWITSQKISAESKDLFREAVICYKASAYRAALLFSYLGLQIILRDRMMSANRPSGIAEGKWEDMLRSLMDEEKKDKVVFDATQMRAPTTVFALSDDMRNQVAYWKGRRNDCAHSKQNMIGYSHVETFWLFLRSNLAKFVVSGSKEGLINSIRDHFDYSLTPRGEDFSYLIEKIPTAVAVPDQLSFFNEVYGIFHPPGVVTPVARSEELEFWSAISNLHSDELNGQLAEFLQTKEDFLLELLRKHPVQIHLFESNSAFLRNLWYSKLFRDGLSNANDITIYCALLRNNLIPGEQIGEANTAIVSRLHDCEVSDDDFRTLKTSSFFEAFHDKAFVQGAIKTFSWANRNASMIALYLERFPFDDSSAKAIQGAFDVPNHPFDVQKSLSRLFEENDEKRDEFLGRLDALNLSRPQYLSSVLRP